MESRGDSMMLESIDLTKTYYDKTVVSKVTLGIETGKIYALLGNNGSGKTTFMKMAAGLVKPSSGTITFQGEQIGKGSKARIAYMPTEEFFYDYMTVKDAGQYYADFYKDFDKMRFEELLTKMELEKKDKVKKLSSGQVAKLRLAVTLARKAKLFMLDEPLNGMDLITRETIITTILEVANEDTTLLISSHLVEELENIVDHIIFFKNGQVKLVGDVEELRESQGKSIVELYKEVLA